MQCRDRLHLAAVGQVADVIQHFRRRILAGGVQRQPQRAGIGRLHVLRKVVDHITDDGGDRAVVDRAHRLAVRCAVEVVDVPLRRARVADVLGLESLAVGAGVIGLGPVGEPVRRAVHHDVHRAVVDRHRRRPARRARKVVDVLLRAVGVETSLAQVALLAEDAGHAAAVCVAHVLGDLPQRIVDDVGQRAFVQRRAEGGCIRAGEPLHVGHAVLRCVRTGVAEGIVQRALVGEFHPVGIRRDHLLLHGLLSDLVVTPGHGVVRVVVQPAREAGDFLGRVVVVGAQQLGEGFAVRLAVIRRQAVHQLIGERRRLGAGRRGGGARTRRNVAGGQIVGIAGLPALAHDLRTVVQGAERIVDVVDFAVAQAAGEIADRQASLHHVRGVQRDERDAHSEEALVIVVQARRLDQLLGLAHLLLQRLRHPVEVAQHVHRLPPGLHRIGGTENQPASTGAHFVQHGIRGAGGEGHRPALPLEGVEDGERAFAVDLFDMCPGALLHRVEQRIERGLLPEEQRIVAVANALQVLEELRAVHGVGFFQQHLGGAQGEGRGDETEGCAAPQLVQGLVDQFAGAAVAGLAAVAVAHHPLDQDRHVVGGGQIAVLLLGVVEVGTAVLIGDPTGGLPSL